MMTKRLRIARILCCILAVACLHGLAFSTELPKTINGGKPVSISVYALPPATDAFRVIDKATVAVAKAFMKRYPNVTIRPFSFIKVPASDGTYAGDTDILMSMAAGTAPDVLQVNLRQSDTFIRQGFLLPLDRFIDNWKNEPGGQEELNRVIQSPKFWNVIRRPGPDGKIHTWAIPPSMLSGTIMYRKDVLRNAGLDPNHPPKTWDEFYQACLQVSDPRKKMYGFNVVNSYHTTWMIWSAGNPILRRVSPKSNDWIAAYDDDAAVRGFLYAWKIISGPWAICPTCEAQHVRTHFVLVPGAAECTCPHGHHFRVDDLRAKNLVFKGVIPPKSPDPDYERFWKAGHQAFDYGYISNQLLFDGIANQQPFADQLFNGDSTVYGFMRPPRSPQGFSRVEVNSDLLAINGTLKDPAKIDAAWNYIRFRSSDEAKRIIVSVAVDNGYAKYVNPALLRQFGYTSYLKETPPGWEA